MSGDTFRAKRFFPACGSDEVCELVLAALMLAVSLTACAATQPYYDGYSNVSTTRNGYVNGTNGYGGMYNGTNYNPGYNGAGYSQSGTASGRTVTGSTSGTAMR